MKGEIGSVLSNADIGALENRAAAIINMSQKLSGLSCGLGWVLEPAGTG